jgi:tetratricopeptide (TPR) repeat protein
VSESSINPVPAPVLPTVQSRAAIRAQLIESEDEPIYGELPAIEAGRWRAMLIVLVIAAVIPFIPVLFNGWLLQDEANITQNTFVQAWGGLKYIWRLPHHFPQFSPLGYSLLTVEVWQFKLAPAGFHAINLALHLINVVLLWTLLRKLELPGSWLATLVFAVHPITLSSVAWVSRQPTLLGTALLLCSLIVYGRFCGLNPRPEELKRLFRLPEAPWLVYTLATFLFLLAVAAYPLAAVFPLVVLVLIWWERGELTLADIKPLIPHLLITLAVFVSAVVIDVKFGTRSGNAISSAIQISPLDRVLVAARGIWFYLFKIALPIKLAFAYPTWETGKLWPIVFVVMLVAALAAIVIFRSRLGRGFVATSLLFLIAIIPVVTIIDPIGWRSSFVADQLAYLAAIAVIIPLVSTLAERYIPKHFSPTSLQPGPYVAIAVVVLLGALAMNLALQYHDQKKLWADTLDKYPDSVVAHNSLGMMEMSGPKADPSKAAEHFREALNIKRDDTVAMISLARAYFNMNEWDRALGQFKMAQAAQPNSPLVYAGLGDLYFQRGYSTPAIEEYEKAIKLDPNNDDLYVNLGRVHEKRGETEAAIDCYRKAIKANPRSVFGHNFLAVLLYNKGRELELGKNPESARPYYEEVAKELQIVNSIDSQYFPVYMSSGAILTNMGAYAKAEIAFRNAVYLQPNSADARSSLAMVQMRLKHFDDAKMHLLAALQLNPNYARAHFFLGMILSIEKDYNGALQHLQQAIDLDAQQNGGAVDATYLKKYREVAEMKR